ncbi:MAG: hypothetical protein KDE27_32910 [Planctomycetes bacterium]|nr:hypothetical protein [Planctomycetota bacterium]
MALAWLPVAVVIVIRLFAQRDRDATSAFVLRNSAVLLQIGALSWMLGLVLVARKPTGPSGVRRRVLAVLACVVPLLLLVSLKWWAG